MNQPLYMMVGGFLGAGKTTAIVALARLLRDRGLRVGLISNDQSVGLVDSVVMSAGNFPVEEITGGCFCCRFNSLVEASERLSKDASPDVFIAEPVGSCTDLVASVSFPLRKIYGDRFQVAPLSVLVDPVRAERVLGLASGGSFSPKVLYVYGKQLEEAEIIAINKCDLLDPARLDRLQSALQNRFPGARILRISARDGSQIPAWLDLIVDRASGAASAPELDYEIYAEGEALLGWLNASVSITSPRELDGNELLRSLAAAIRSGLPGLEIAHLKMTLVPDVDGGDIGVLNLVRSDGAAEISHSLKAPIDSADLLINLRAESDPDILKRSVMDALSTSGFEAELRNIEHFRPGKPEPTYRMATSES